MASKLPPAHLVESPTAENLTEIHPQRALPEIPGDAPYCFRGRKILMLQGPVGPFFNRLAKDLRWAGANVHKVNFNGGDWFYFPRDATGFTDNVAAFPAFLERICDEKRIDTIMLFGDCRDMHRIASDHAEARDIEVYVFEEGYIRPDYITMEKYGVNGRSAMPRAGIFYLNTPAPDPLPPAEIGQTFWRTAGWAFTYYFWSIVLWPLFARYRHHRTLSWFDGLRWVRGSFRKSWYQWREAGVVERLTRDDHPRFFLVPLQVHNDAQVGVHSVFDDIEEFIRDVTASFAAHAPDDIHLVIKHHPVDRPYTDYSTLIHKLREETGLGGRLIYVHDPHLPTLIGKAEGIVTINSTTGLSAIHHGKPTLALGNAVYRIDGLTATVSLDRFWISAQDFPVHADLYRNYRHQLIHRTQLNGNFYKRLKIPGSMAGIDWSRGKPTDSEDA